MKKFLCKLLTYTVLVSVVIATLDLIYIYKTLDSEEAKFRNVPDGIQICNFGSSHGLNGFNYEDAKRKYVCFNFGLGGQRPYFDEKILRNYSNNIRKGAAVFIVLSHFSFFGKYGAENSRFSSMNRRYYKFLSPDLIDYYDRKTDIYVNYLPAFVSGNIVTFLKTMLIPHKDLWENATDREFSLIHGMRRYNNFIARNKDRFGRRNHNQENIDTLYRIIEICRNIGATPILITTPYLNEYNNAVKENDPEFYTYFYGVINEITKNTGVKYYDYSSDERYSNDYRLFVNTDHLNRRGARLFTNNLLREVLEIDVTAD